MEENEVNKPLNNVGFSANNSVDRELIAEANTFLSYESKKDEYSGINSKLSILRTFIINKLREENAKRMAEQAKAG